MKILFISDIHGIPDYLDVIDQYKYDELIVLGDLFSYGNESSNIVGNAEVQKFLKNHYNKILCVKGNCDSGYDYRQINLPVNNDFLHLKIDNLNIYCTHGHLYNYHNLSFGEKSGILIYGHEHVPYIESFNDMTYICVGSISKPRYASKPSFCIYEDRIFTIYSIDGEIIDRITK